MATYRLSAHARQEAERRAIPITLIEQVLAEPEQAFSTPRGDCPNRSFAGGDRLPHKQD